MSFQGPNNRATFVDNSGTSVIDRIAGTLQKSDDNGATFGPIGGGGGNTFTLADASTTQQPVLIIANHTSSATAAAGFGGTIGVGLQNAAGTLKRAFNLIAQYVSPTDAAEVSSAILSAFAGGVLSTLATFDWFAGDSGSPRISLGPNTQTGIMRHDATGTGAMLFLAGGAFVLTAIGTQLQPLVDVAMQAKRLMFAEAGATAVATTITLPTTGNSFPLTVGTGTLNSISLNGMAAGSWFVLGVPTGVTITHNVSGTGATILTSSAASIASTALGRPVFCYYDGTNVLAQA